MVIVADGADPAVFTNSVLLMPPLCTGDAAPACPATDTIACQGINKEVDLVQKSTKQNQIVKKKLIFVIQTCPPLCVVLF